MAQAAFYVSENRSTHSSHSGTGCAACAKAGAGMKHPKYMLLRIAYGISAYTKTNL